MGTVSFEHGYFRDIESRREQNIRLLGLRNLDPLAIIDGYSAFTRERFSSPDGLPVIIPAHNEERDIPSTLLALARSEIEVMPIVMDNGSSDHTADFARQMGAKTITESEPSKMRATQLGLEYAKSLGHKRVLFTDADTLPGKKWAAAMYGLSQDIDLNSGGLLAGPVFFDHGPSLATDGIRTLNGYLRDVSRKMSTTKLPLTRGANYLLTLDHEGLLYEGLQRLPANLFPGEDLAIRDTVVQNGGKVVSTLRPETFVYTRNDRFRNLGAAVLARFQLRPRASFYADDTPAGFQMYVTPYDSIR